MAAPGVCPQCGERMPADRPHGICPSCLMRLGFAEPVGGSSGDAATRHPAGRFLAPDPLALASQFPQLEIMEFLGQGGMGAVYRARQKTLDRVVALKILPVDVGRDPAFAERFMREARAMARLTHPHIVMIFDFGETSDYFYFLMEYVDGVNLRQALQDGALRPDDALAIVPQICEALQYAHDQGIVHRDIKPENVLLDRRGQVKIADFGLAKLLRQPGSDWSLTGTGQVVGTLHYMAPEQIERPLSVDHRADIYSLGVVFYELLTGELPLGRFAPPSRKSAVSADLDQVVLRTLEKEPGQRFQQASEVKTAVETAGRVPPAARAFDVEPPDTFRHRLPFAIHSLYGGFAKADGILRFDGQTITAEFQVRDELLGCLTSRVRTVTIPWSEIISLDWVTGWFQRRNTLELRVDKIGTLREVPGSERGTIRLRIASHDMALAEAFVAVVGRPATAAPPQEMPAAESGKPPVRKPTVDGGRTVQSVRSASAGLLVVAMLQFVTLIPAALVLYVALFAGRLDTGAHGQTIRWEQGQSVRIGATPIRVSTRMPVSESHSAPTWALSIMSAAITVPLVGIGVLIGIGAMKMRRFESHGWGLTAAVLAAAPVHPWFVVGLPLGVWALVVLLRAETQEAFRQREQGGRLPWEDGGAAYVGGPTADRRPDAVPSAVRPEPLPWLGWGFLIVGVLNGISLLPLISLVMRGGATFLLLLIVAGVMGLLAMVGALQAWAGVSLLTGRRSSLTVPGVVISLLPVAPLWLFSLPLGVIGLLHLRRRSVPSGVDSQWEWPAASSAVSSRSWQPAGCFILATVGMLALGAGALLAFVLAFPVRTTIDTGPVYMDTPPVHVEVVRPPSGFGELPEPPDAPEPPVLELPDPGIKFQRLEDQ